MGEGADFNRVVVFLARKVREEREYQGNGGDLRPMITDCSVEAA